MDNYPQINLRRVLKGVDFATFYKVAKSRPEIFDILTEYEFDNEQTKEILNAFVSNLSIEKIKSCAIPDFSGIQMNCIYNVYISGFTIEQVSLFLNPAFCYAQMKWIIRGIEEGFKDNKIRLYAKPELMFDQMEQIYWAIKDGLSIKKIRLFAKPKFTAKQMHEIRLAFSSFESALTYEQVRAIANPKLSAEQISTLKWGYDLGLTIEQIERIVKEDYTNGQMTEIIEAYSDKFTDDQMVFILNISLSEYQMRQIRYALNAGVSNEIMAIISTGEYNDELIKTIVNAYKHGSLSDVRLFLNPQLDDRQVEIIWKCCYRSILTFNQIEFLANSQNNYLKMGELARWFEDDFSIEQVREYAEKFNAEQMEKIRYGLKRKLKFMDLWVKPEFDECQMQQAIYGIEKGFTKEQLLIYLNPELSAHYMEIVRMDIEAGVPVEKVKLYASRIPKKAFEKTRIKVLCDEIEKLM